MSNDEIIRPTSAFGPRLYCHFFPIPNEIPPIVSPDMTNVVDISYRARIVKLSGVIDNIDGSVATVLQFDRQRQPGLSGDS